MTKTQQKELNTLLQKERNSILSEEEAMRVRELSPHFHSKEKGCEIIPTTITVSGNKYIKGGYCKTHKIEICHCGWEWHWHYGIYHGGLFNTNNKK